jgi:hypothetical protein
MRTEKLRLLLRKRIRALVGATAVVAALWLLSVLVSNAFASSSLLGDRDHHVPQGEVRLPGGVLKHTGPKGGLRLALLHNTGGTPTDLAAWHTVVQCLILISLAALVVAGLDRVRRKGRRTRRARMG